MEQRRNFLQSVREKSEERAWKRRDIEGNVRNTYLLANLLEDRLLTCYRRSFKKQAGLPIWIN